MLFSAVWKRAQPRKNLFVSLFVSHTDTLTRLCHKLLFHPSPLSFLVLTYKDKSMSLYTGVHNTHKNTNTHADTQTACIQCINMQILTPRDKHEYITPTHTKTNTTYILKHANMNINAHKNTNASCTHTHKCTYTNTQPTNMNS